MCLYAQPVGRRLNDDQPKTHRREGVPTTRLRLICDSYPITQCLPISRFHCDAQKKRLGHRHYITLVLAAQVSYTLRHSLFL